MILLLLFILVDVSRYHITTISSFSSLFTKNNFKDAGLGGLVD